MESNKNHGTHAGGCVRNACFIDRNFHILSKNVFYKVWSHRIIWDNFCSPITLSINSTRRQEPVPGGHCFQVLGVDAVGGLYSADI